MTTKELENNLKSREWRLNNLFWIKNKAGLRIKFKLNWMQKHLLDNLWFLNIIVKARQLGTTTFFCILYLDDCVFNGYDCGLIAHTIDAAKKIFDTKIKYAWDNMPEVLKEQFQVDKDTARELKFTRGKQVSSIYVGTSLRSGTVQRLHISELSTLDQKYPQKSLEIKTGALNTVHKGNIVTIESTAKGQAGVFYDIAQVAMDLKKSGAKLTEMDYRFFFFPWWEDKEYQLKGDIIIPTRILKYFEKLEKNDNIVLTKEQRNWYYKKVLEQKDKMKSEFPATPTEAFQMNLEGAYFGKQMDRVMEENRITKVPYDPLLPVDTWWDLGVDKKRSDAMAVVFTQSHRLELRMIDYFGQNREGLPYFAKMLDKKPYKYKNHYAPHDIEVKEIGAGKTRFDMAAQVGIHFNVMKPMAFLDSIEAVKNVLARCWFDEERTEQLVKALKAFRKEWDERLGKWKDTPLKDWSSDPCFLAGTKILTIKGEVNIEDIKIGDKVITPFGIRKVLNAGKSGRVSQFYELYYGKKKLQVTGNHKVFINNSFDCIANLCYDRVKLESFSLFNLIKWRIKKKLYIKEKDIGFTEVITRRLSGIVNLPHCKGQFGVMFMEKFLLIVISIILMVIKLIMKLAIWSVLMVKNIIVSIVNKFIKISQSCLKNFIKEELRQRKNGTHQKKDYCGIQNTEKKLGKQESRFLKFVCGVIKNIKHFIQLVQSFVLISVEVATVMNVPRTKEKYLRINQDVDIYNITVDKDNVYYANGVLVRNCDAFRLMCVAQQVDPLGEYYEEEAALERQLEANEGFDANNPFPEL